MALLEATDCLELNAKYPRCSASRAHYIGVDTKYATGVDTKYATGPVVNEWYKQTLTNL